MSLRSVLGASGSLAGPLGVSGGTLAWYLADGAPAPVAAYQPKGAASLAASYVNLANPGTYNAAPGVAPTFNTATGWTFDGSSQYLTTGYTAPNIAGSYLIRYSAAANQNYMFGAYTADNQMIGLRRMDAIYVVANGNYATAPGNATSGVLAVAGLIGYHNGIFLPGGISDGGTAPTPIITIGQLAGAAGYYAGDIQAVAIYSTTLPGPQMAAVSAAMAAL